MSIFGVDQGILLRVIVNWSGVATFDKSFSTFFFTFFASWGWVGWIKYPQKLHINIY
jgi:hypothetical protein